MVFMVSTASDAESPLDEDRAAEQAPRAAASEERQNGFRASHGPVRNGPGGDKYREEPC